MNTYNVITRDSVLFDKHYTVECSDIKELLEIIGALNTDEQIIKIERITKAEVTL
jgi:hypothetical protein